MHRDRLRWLFKEDRHQTLTGAAEIAKAVPAIINQLDAAKRFLNEQTDENAAALQKLLDEH